MIYYFLILLGIFSRIMPHLFNFTAVGATALFSGYYLRNKKNSFLIPLIIMLLTDWYLGFYDWRIMASVYLSFSFVVFLGILIKRKKWFYSLPASVLGSLVFFFVTNLAVWQFGNWYPYNFSGLLDCLISGLPFLKNSLLGDLSYTFILFSVAELATFLAKKTKPKIEEFLLVGSSK